MPRPASQHRRAPLLVVLFLLRSAAAAPSGRAASGFDLPEPGATPGPALVAGAGPASLARARLLPAALALAASEARRGAAAAVARLDDLRPGPDGSVDVALASVIDLTLQHNLDLLVRSYDPAVAAEAVKARAAIFDPLLRFTLSLFSSTSPTSATLAGAAVLTRRERQWDFEGQEILPWGGQASIGFTNSRVRSNNVFATLNPAYQSALSFSLDQPLLRDYGRDLTRREIRIARNDRAASREGFREQVMAKVTEAIDAYWDLYGKRDGLKVQREGLSLAEDLLRINRTRVEVGTMAPLDVATAEAEVARNEELVIAAEAEVRSAEDRLRQLINLPLGSPLWSAPLRPVDLPALEEQPIDVEAAIATAFEKRGELRRQQLALASDAIRLAYARNQRRPGLNLQASYGLAGLGGTEIVRAGFGEEEILQVIPGGYRDALDQLFSLDFDTWRLGAVVAFPVFNQLARANHATALLQMRRDQDSLELIRQSVAVEVRRLARAVETGRKRTQAAGSTRTLQEKRLDAERKKFEHGLSTNFEVAQAQKDLTQARTGEVVAITDYRRSLAALERATGTVLEAHDIHIDE